MSEPGAGSDLQGIRNYRGPRWGPLTCSTARRPSSPTASWPDLVIVVARTDTGAGPPGGISLLVVERGMAGFERGRNLEKVGMATRRTTSELFFLPDVVVPAANLLGEEGGGFVALMQNLPRERVAIGATAPGRAAEKVFEGHAGPTCKERQAFRPAHRQLPAQPLHAGRDGPPNWPWPGPFTDTGRWWCRHTDGELL